MSFPVPSDLPAGYFVEESPRGVLVLHADVARLLHESGYGPESDGDLARSELQGRRPLYRLGAGEEELVVRRFSHGGLLRWLTRDRFRDPTRPFRELLLADSLRRVGIRTPKVVAARALAARGGGWLLDIVSRRVPGAVDLGAVLSRVRAGELAPRDLRALFVAAGDLVRQLHQNGLQHADLTPKNMLVQGEPTAPEPHLWILDLDRSVRCRALTEAQRRSNLRRLYRYVARRDARYGRSLTRTDYARFLRGYDPELARWKDCWRHVQATHARSQPMHRAGWLFERLMGGRGPSADEAAADVLYPVRSEGPRAGEDSGGEQVTAREHGSRP